MRKRITSVIRRVDIDTFDLILKCINECADCKKIVAVNEHIAWPWFPIRKSACLDLPITMEWVMDKEARLNGKRLVLLANPRKFEFIYRIRHLIVSILIYIQLQF